MTKAYNNMKKTAQAAITEIQRIRDNMAALVGRIAPELNPEDFKTVTEQMMENIVNLQNVYQLSSRQSEEMADVQNQMNTGVPNILENTGNIAMNKNKIKKAFNLKKAQFENPMGQPAAVPEMADTFTDPELVGDSMDDMGMEGLDSTGLDNLKDGADLKDRLDAMDYRNARDQLLNYIEDPDQQQTVEDALSTFYQEDLESNEKLGVSIRIFDLLPDMLKITDPNDESLIEAPFTQAKVDEEIKKLAKKYAKKEIKAYNLIKTAQHKTLENAVVWNTNQPRIDPFLRQPVSDWHIMERNKGFGLTVGDIWNIDWESIWRGNIMDKYSRPYKDAEGKWVGGYLNKRFEIDSNVPETNNYQLKPGQRRRPILPEYGNTESRLEAAREKGDIAGGPVVEGKPFNWKEANSKKKS